LRLDALLFFSVTPNRMAALLACVCVASLTTSQTASPYHAMKQDDGASGAPFPCTMERGTAGLHVLSRIFTEPRPYTHVYSQDLVLFLIYFFKKQWRLSGVDGARRRVACAGRGRTSPAGCLDAKEFKRVYLGQQAVLIRGLTEGWAARTAWRCRPEMVAHHGDAPV
jgi:hypothetical protein